MAFREQFVVWVRFLAVLAFVVWTLLFFFGFFDDGSFLYKPCAEAAKSDDLEGGGSDDAWMNCVDYYMKEEGWTYEEIVNGVIIEGE